MKVLQVNSFVNSGSTGRIAEQIGELIIRNGWDSIIAFGRSSNKSKSRTFRIGNEVSIFLHGVFSMIFGKHGFYSKQSTLKLIEFIKHEKPDIIHLHNIHGYYLNYPMFFEFLLKFNGKLVWTLHDCWTFTGHCSYFSDISCNKWKLECNSCPKVRNYPKSVFFDDSLGNYYYKKESFNSVSFQIVTVSKWLKGLVEESFLKNHNVISISNGVNSKVFSIKEKNSFFVEKYGLNRKRMLIAASTSWAKQKGLDDYFELASLLNEQFVIVLVGLPEKYYPKLPENIIGVPRTESAEELASWYNTSDIVMNLSYQETFGLTSVEGFMCGKPTIVYNSTASPELIVNPILGRIVEPGNIQEVCVAINQLLEFGDKNRNLIRQLAIENFDSESQYMKYIDLYKKLLS